MNKLSLKFLLVLLVSANAFANDKDCKIFIAEDVINPAISANDSQLPLIKERLQNNGIVVVDDVSQSTLILKSVWNQADFGCLGAVCRDFHYATMTVIKKTENYNPNGFNYAPSAHFRGKSVASKFYMDLDKQFPASYIDGIRNKALSNALDKLPLSCSDLQNSLSN